MCRLAFSLAFILGREQPPVALGNIVFHFQLLKHQGCLAPQFPVCNWLLADFIFLDALLQEDMLAFSVPQGRV